MKNDRKHIQRGKHLVFLLRHDRNYKFDEHGWREVCDTWQLHKRE